METPQEVEISIQILKSVSNAIRKVKSSPRTHEGWYTIAFEFQFLKKLQERYSIKEL